MRDSCFCVDDKKTTIVLPRASVATSNKHDMADQKQCKMVADRGRVCFVHS